MENPDRQAFVIAPLPEMIIPKGMASEGLLTDILINKYFYTCRSTVRYKK